MRPLPHFILWMMRLKNAETQTTDAERTLLADYARGKQRLVEVGVWHGFTTALLRSVMSPGGVLFAVDPYPPGQLGISLQRVIARCEVKRVSGGQVQWLQVTGAEAGRQFAASNEPLCDFVFIDGDHSYNGLRGDWESWCHLLQPGGIVALHDSRSCALRQIDSAGSVKFTKEVILNDPDFELIDSVDTVSILRKHSRAVSSSKTPNSSVVS